MAGVLALQILIVMAVMAWYGSNVLKLLDNYFHSEFQKHLANEKRKLRDPHDIKHHQNIYTDQIFSKKQEKQVQLAQSDRHHRDKNKKTEKGESSFESLEVDGESEEGDQFHQHFQEKGHRYPLEGGRRDLKHQMAFKEFQEGNHVYPHQNKLLMEKTSSDFSKETLEEGQEDNHHPPTTTHHTLGYSQIQHFSSVPPNSHLQININQLHTKKPHLKQLNDEKHCNKDTTTSSSAYPFLLSPNYYNTPKKTSVSDENCCETCERPRNTQGTDTTDNE